MFQLIRLFFGRKCETRTRCLKDGGTAVGGKRRKEAFAVPVRTSHHSQSHCTTALLFQKPELDLLPYHSSNFLTHPLGTDYLRSILLPPHSRPTQCRRRCAIIIVRIINFFPSNSVAVAVSRWIPQTNVEYVDRLIGPRDWAFWSHHSRRSSRDVEPTPTSHARFTVVPRV